MRFRSKPSFAAHLAIFSVWACACSRSGGPTAAPSGATVPSADLFVGAPPETVVAAIGDAPIKMKEVDEAVAAQLRELADQAYDIRRQGLEQLINQRLVQKAAFAQGMSEEQFLQEAVEKKAKEPAPEEVKKFFEQNSAQLPPGAKFDDFKERIGAFLKRQQQSERAKEVFSELRKDAQVTISLKPPPKPRIEIAPTGPTRGPADAKVTIVEFSDFECPFCSRARDVADKVMEKFEGKAKLVFRQFPLSFHSHARKAAEASLCADQQGKFWPYHDALFANQKELAVEDLKKVAKTLKLDQEKFDTCLDSGATAKQVTTDMADGQKAGVTGTPAFFVNGVMLSGAQPVEEFARVIEGELVGAK